MSLVPLSAWGAYFFEQRGRADDVRLAALAPLGSGVVRVDVAAPVGAKIGLGLDEGPRIGDDVDDALVESLGRDRFGEKFSDAGIARLHHALFLRMAGEHDDRRISVG